MVPFPATLGCFPAVGAGVAGGQSWAAGASSHPGLCDTAAPSGSKCWCPCRTSAGLGNTGSGTERRENQDGAGVHGMRERPTGNRVRNEEGTQSERRDCGTCSLVTSGEPSLYTSLAMLAVTGGLQAFSSMDTRATTEPTVVLSWFTAGT